MQDAIRIFLIENLLNTEYADTIMLILERTSNVNYDLSHMLFTFSLKQDLFVVLCNIIEAYQQIKGENSTGLDA